jgi:hypothetical protein
VSQNILIFLISAVDHSFLSLSFSFLFKTQLGQPVFEDAGVEFFKPIYSHTIAEITTYQSGTGMEDKPPA